MKTIGVSWKWNHLERSLKSYNSIKIWCTVISKHYVLCQLYFNPIVKNDCWRGYPETKSESEKSLKKHNNYQNLVYCNRETICAVPPMVLSIRRSDENSRRNYPETKPVRKIVKKKNIISIKIWCTVTLKQYALYHLMVQLSIKFQHGPRKTVGVFLRRVDGRMDGQTDTSGYTIIPRHYLVAGYNEDVGYHDNS